MKKYVFALSLVFIGAFLLRIVGLSSYPVGFTQDEAGLGYDAYSLLLTGKDQWGKSWPLVFRSFGDFKMPLYSYLTIPAVFLLGLSEFSVRLPNAIMGSFAVVATYLLVSEMTKRKDFGLWSALFLAISPWHIGLSRGAFEANLTTFFIPFGIWAFIKGIKNPKWTTLSAISLGLNLFSYHSARIITPALVIILVVSYWDKLRTNLFNRYKASTLVFGLFLLAATVTMFTGGAKRGLDITILNPTDKWAAVAMKRYESIMGGTPEPVARMFSNKVLYVFTTFSKNYLSYFSTSFLFSEGAAEANYGLLPGRGVLYQVEIIFIIVAFISFCRKNGFKLMGLILLWLVIAPIPAALTKGPGYAANRAIVMLPALQILSAWGLVYLLDLFKKKYSNKISFVFTGIVVIILGLSLAGFLDDYRNFLPQKSSNAMQYGMRELVSTISKIEDNYEQIVLSRTLSVPNIWVQFYEMVDPKLVQKSSRSWLRYESQGVKYLDQIREYSLGKYSFGDIIIDDLKGQNILAVGRVWEFPENVRTIAAIKYLDGEPAFILVDANGL